MFLPLRYDFLPLLYEQTEFFIYYEHLSLYSAISIVALQIFILALRTERIFYLL